MKKIKTKRYNKRNIILIVAVIVLLFSVINIGTTFSATDKFSLVNVEIINKSGNAEVNDIKYEEGIITNNIIFHKIGDSVTYKITIKNNTDKKFILNSINNNNENEYINYEYNNVEGIAFNPNEEKSINITAKYIKELMDISERNQTIFSDFSFDFEDENGEITNENVTINTSNNTLKKIENIFNTSENKKNQTTTEQKLLSMIPKAGDNTRIYIILVILSIILIVFITINTKTKENRVIKKKEFKIFGLFLIIAIMVPTMSNANSILFNISLQNIVTLQDKLIVNYQINREEISNIVKYGDKLEKPENPELAGYDFEGWFLENGTEFNYNSVLTEDLLINARFKVIEYNITYDLKNGNETQNPKKYTIESDNIIINPPVKEGYNFIGWTGIGITDLTENLIIPKGSYGNKSFEANYEPINYRITYNGLENDEKILLNNPENYTIESEKIILRNPVDRKDIDGDITQRFVGWEIDQTTAVDVTIESGSIGNKEYTAIWEDVEPNEYLITYLLDGGNFLNENPTKITKFTETFILNNPTKEGYNFIGWTGSNGNEPEIIVEIQKGMRENLNFIANYEKIKYLIDYDLDGGSAINDESYDIETEDIILTNPEKEGYTFTGWSGTDLIGEDNIIVIIPKGSMGDRTYIAHYELNKYTLVFNSNTGTGSMENQEIEYNRCINIKTNEFLKTGYVFKGWNTKEDGTGINYNDGEEVINLATCGTITLYAQWQEIIYFIEFNANGGTGNLMENQKISYNEEVQLNPNTYTYPDVNYLFVGWNTEPDGSGTYYTDEQTVINLTNINNQVITLYAIWMEFKVGDYVNYNPASGDGFGLQYTSEDLNAVTHNDTTCKISGKFKSNESIRWRIFSIEDDGIQLIAEKPLMNTLKLNGVNGYIYGEEILNDICDIYGHGVGAIEGRSIKLEDIEPHFKYDKRSFTYGNAYYGRVKSYTSGNFIVDNDIVTASTTQNQNVPYTAFWFNVKRPENIYSQQENAVSNKIYQMLCEDISIINPNGNNPNYTPYWIASRCTRSDDSFCAYALHYMGDMHSGGNAQVELGIRSMYSVNGNAYEHENGILPIVKLNSLAKLKYNSDNSDCWDIDYTPVNYTVSFNSNGGIGEMQDEEFEKGIGKKLTRNTFEREGFVFDGWNTCQDGSGIYYGNEQILKDLLVNDGENIKLYAIWIDLKVGDYVNYSSESGEGFGLEFNKSKLLDGTSIPGESVNNFKTKEIQKWRVFSTKNGVIKLIAEKPTNQIIRFEGDMGYKNCVKVLNEIAKIYGKGIGAAEARSICLEDIESYFKYDKTTFMETDNNHNFTVRYGDTKTYTSGRFLVNNEFVTASNTESQIATQTAYWYDINENVYYTEEENEIANKIYNMLCVDIPVSNENNSQEYTPYALANTCVYLRHDCTQNYVRYIGDLHGNGYPEMGGVWLSTSSGSTGRADLHVLPIITLDSSIILSKNIENDSWNINVNN